MKVSFELSRRKLLVLVLILTLVGAGSAYAVFNLTQTATYTVGTAPTVLATLNFGTLFNGSTGTMNFPSAITLNSATGTVTISPIGSWSQVFSSISVTVTVHGTTTVKITSTLATTSFNFAILSGETGYDYSFSYTTVTTLPTTPPTMQLTVTIG